MTGQHRPWELDMWRMVFRLGLLGTVVDLAGMVELCWFHDYSQGVAMVYALVITVGTAVWARWKVRRLRRVGRHSSVMGERPAPVPPLGAPAPRG